MLALPAYLLLLVILVVGLFSLTIAWGSMIVLCIGLLFLLLVWKARSGYKPFDGLSPTENDLLRRHWAFYTSPRIGIELGGIAAAVGVAAGILGAISIFQGFWWGLGIAVVVWVGMAVASAHFNPTNAFRYSETQEAHDRVHKFMEEYMLELRKSQGKSNSAGQH
jgi:hypothetical protein